MSEAQKRKPLLLAALLSLCLAASLFAQGGECAQELLFTFRRAGNNFKYDTYLDVFTRKLYPRFVIIELYTEYSVGRYARSHLSTMAVGVTQTREHSGDIGSLWGFCGYLE